MKKFYIFLATFFAAMLTVSAQGIGKALDFDGGDDYVTVAQSTPVIGFWTISAWVQPKHATKNMHIFDSRTPNDNGFDMQILNGNTIHCDIGNGTTWKTTSANATYNYTPGVWFHVALSVDYEGYHIYVNGKIIASGPLDTIENNVLIDNNHQLQIGRNPNYNTYYRGAIDEVRINYTSGHPSEATMTAEMNSPVFVMPSAVLAYTFNNASTTANGNNPGQTTVVNTVNATRYGTMNSFYLESPIGNWTTDRDYYSIMVNGTTYYQNLKSAFDAINAGTHTGNITIQVIRDTNEPDTAQLNGSGTGSANYTSVTITPVGGVQRTINTGGHGIFLSNASNVTIDGLNTNGNSLKIVNVNAGFSTIWIHNNANSNTIRKCTVLGSGAAGIIKLTNAGSHTINNTITECTIGPLDTNVPNYGIYWESNSVYRIMGLVITSNNIYDYAIAGVCGQAGTVNAAINGNKLFQTAPKTISGGHYGIMIGNSYADNQLSTINNNTIGYASATGTGTYFLMGTGFFKPIAVLNSELTSGSTTISNNTIAGITMSGNFSGEGLMAPFAGIAGYVGGCTIQNNTIGSLTGSSAISFTSTSSTASEFYAIYKGSTGDFDVSFNNIGGITAISNGQLRMSLIKLVSTAFQETVRYCVGNTVGGTTSHSISNLTTAAGSDIVGISTEKSTSVWDNTVRNITGKAPDATGRVTGISVNIVSQYSSGVTVSRNKIYNLTNTSSTPGMINGIEGYSSQSIAFIQFDKNYIYGFNTAAAGAVMTGMKLTGRGHYDVFNNMVSLGTTVPTATTIRGIYGETLNTSTTEVTVTNNSLYIGGTQTTGTAGSEVINVSNISYRRYFNNIFVNNRTNSGATGNHYCMNLSILSTMMYMDKNIYFGNGTGFMVANLNGANRTTFTDYRNNLGPGYNEGGGFFSNPQYLDPANATTPNLHLSTTIPTYAEGNADNDTGYRPAEDIDNQARSGATDIGADEGNFTVFAAPVITNLSATSGCIGSSLTITGNNFYQVTAVRIGTTNCTITGSTSNSVTVTVPSGASGAVAVDAFTGTGTGSTFTIIGAPVITAQPTAPAAICTYESTTISVTATGGSTYKWRRNGVDLTNTAPFSNVTTATLTITNPDFSQNGSLYDVVISAPGNCGTVTSNQVALTVKQRPTIGVSSNVIICRNNSTTLTANGGASYTWSPATGLSATTGASVTATPTATTTYTVTGTSAGGCTNTNTVTVTVNQLPTIDVTPTSAAVCPGSGATLTASGGVSYTWSPATGLNTTTGATVIATPSSTTTYTVSGTDANGCVNTKTVTVTVRSLPTIGVSPTGVIMCNGVSQTFTANGAVSYTWSPATGLSAVTGASVTANPTTTTTYTVTGTDANGCVNTATFTVTVLPLPTVNVSGGGAVCPGSGRTLTASGSSASYLWSPSTGLNTITGATVIASPASTTTYTVKASGPNGCYATNTVTVTVNALPTVNISPPAPTICNGSSVTLTASGASTYVWTPSTGLNTTTGDTVICSSLISRTYYVTGTDSNGCSNTQFVNVIVNPKPTLNITPSATTICPGSYADLSITGADSYTWSPSVNILNGNQSLVRVYPSVTTTYTATGTGSNGCTNTKTVTVTVDTNGPFNFDVTNPVICSGAGQPISITGGGAGNSYSWSPSTGLNTTTGTSVTASPTTTTTYTVQCTTAAGCISSRQITVTVNQILNVSVQATQGTICQGGNTTLTADGADTYSWSPSTGLNTVTGSSVIASPASTTTYTVTGTANANGCNNTSQITVTVTPISGITVPFDNITKCSAEPALALNVIGGAVETLIIDENFDNNAPTWTFENEPSSPPEAQWSFQETSPGNKAAKSNPEPVYFEAFVNTSLVSPSFSTMGYEDCVLSFGQSYYNVGAYTELNVQLSTDGGSTWTLLENYGDDDISNYAQYTINLHDYINMPNLKLRFTHIVQGGVPGWYIDGLQVKGISSNTTWSPTAGLYLDPDATIAYTGETRNQVYAKPASTTIYTATTPAGIGCSAINTIDVTVLQSPSMTITGNTSFCQGSSTALHINGTGAISYDWSPATGLDTTSGTDVIANPSETTTYTVTATAANGCITTKEVIVTFHPYIPATINTTAVTSCIGTPAVALEVNDPMSVYMLINEDFEDYAPDWENAGWFFNYNGPTGLQAQSPYFTSAYSYMATPAFNTTGFSSCVLTFDSFYGSWYGDWFIGVQVTVDNGANWDTVVNYTSNIAGVAHNRQNMTINLDAYVNQPNVKVRFFYGTNGGYVWNFDNVQIKGFASNTTWSPVTGLYTDAAATIPYTGQKAEKVFAKPSATTLYTADTTIPGGCQTINTVSVTVTPSPSISITGNTDSCTGVGTVLSVTGADTYSWSPSTGLNTDTGDTVIADPSTTTTYTVTGTTSGCSSTQTITITPHNYQPATVPYNSIGACAGNSIVQLSVNDPASDYRPINQNFEVNPSDWIIVTNNAYPGHWYYNYDGPSNRAAMAYPSGGAVDSQLISPIFSTVGLPNLTLDFDFITYAGSSDLGTAAIDISTDGGNTWTQLHNYAGNDGYMMHANIDLHDYLNEANMRIRFNYVSAASSQFRVDNVVIRSQIVTSTWSPLDDLYTDAAATIPYNGEPLETVYANPATTTLYTVLTSPLSGCTTTNTISVNVGVAPAITVSDDVTICAGGTGVTLTASGAINYIWSPSTGLNNTTGDTVIANPASTTTYTVTADSGGCTTVETVTVTVVPAMTATMTATTAATCAGMPAVLLEVNDPQSVYALVNEDFEDAAPDWNLNGWNIANGPTGLMAQTPALTGSDVTMTSPSFSTMGYQECILSFDGQYRNYPNDLFVGIEVSTDNGISWNTAANYTQNGFNTGTVVVLDDYLNQPSVMVRFHFYTFLGIVWEVDNVKISGITSNTVWSPATNLFTDAAATIPYNGENTNKVYAMPSATTVYTATSTNSGGCESINTITVTVAAAPDIDISDDITTCEGTAVTLTASGAVNYTWSPATGLNTTTGDTVIANPTSTTTYTVTADNGGCTTVETVTVNVNPGALTVTPTTAVIANGDNVTLQASGADTYTWSPSTGLNTTTGDTVIASPSVSTTYTVTAMTASGCTFTKSVTVTVNQQTFTDNSLHFDGIDDFINMPTSPVTVSHNFTIEGWFKPEEATKRMHLFSTRGGGDMTFDLQILDGYLIHADLGTGYYWDNTAADIGFAYTPDTWMHIACVVSPEKYKLYVNGNLVGELDVYDNLLLLNGNHFLSLGNSQNEDTFYKGNIDDVRIYNTLRSQSQVQSDMNGDAPGSGIVARYDFNVGTPGGNNAGLTTLPAVNGGTGFDGTLYNFALNGNSSNWVLGRSLPAYCNGVTVWNGTSWSNGAPDVNTAAIISGNFTSDGDLYACTLTVGNNADVIISDNDDFNIHGTVSILSGATLTIEDGSNLLQDLDEANSGNIIVKKQAQMVRQDYVYWSSPVIGQNLKDFSPETLNNRFYTLDEANNSFAWVDPVANDFQPGVGFMVRAPNNFQNPPALPQPFMGIFEGIPTNGPIDATVTTGGYGYNLIGNPYPSSVNADLFLAQNPGTLYYWTHRVQGAASGANYCSYNTLGGTAAVTGGDAPNGYIAPGQGFIIQTVTAGAAHFDNTMRSGNDAIFYRDSNEKHRFWLNLNSPDAGLNQILVGYMEGATSGADISIDGKQIEGGSSISSLIDGLNYVIQGRPLPFESSDIVPLNFKATTAGTFTIEIDHMDGLFSGDQEIYLKDNLLGTIQSIKQTGYTFASAEGTFANRFEIVYTNSTLGTDNPIADENSVILYKQNGILKIDSGKMTMQTVHVFDIRGRLIYTADAVNASKASLDELRAEQQVLLVQITSDDNQVITKKAVY